MTCDEIEVELVTCDTPSAAVLEHVATCERCRAFQASSAQLLGDAALPALSLEEKAKLSTLPSRVQQGLERGDRRQSFVRRAVSLAMAACLGAAVASAALLPRIREAQAEVVVSDLGFPDLELASSSDTEDELDAFEVSWPSPY
ncbi:MAG: hypothetical protein JNK82_37480 [Myxococcaceae bacterium]|nr:hypothetical protein [Myxococcaceae bacterium]